MEAVREAGVVRDVLRELWPEVTDDLEDHTEDSDYSHEGVRITSCAAKLQAAVRCEGRMLVSAVRA